MDIARLIDLILIVAATGYAYDYARNKKPLSAALTVFCGLAALV